MDAVGGHTGELLDRLTRLLNSNALGEGQWSNISAYAAMFLGGRALDEVVPDTGPPVPGSIGELERQQREVVSRESYFELIKNRLSELITSGVEEAFLVRSVRDAIRQQLESLADVGAVDSKREETRAKIERVAEDPDEIAIFRAILAEKDPSAGALSDDEIAARLHRMAGRVQPMSPDEAAGNWTLLANWEQQAASLLPDAIFAGWSYLRDRA